MVYLSKSILIRFPFQFYFEIALLFSMIVTLFIPLHVTAVMVWEELSILSYIRAVVWLFGLSILPGLYIIRLAKVSDYLSKMEKIVIEINLSLVLVGIITLIFYYAQVSAVQFPWIFIGILLIFSSLYWIRRKDRGITSTTTITKWHILLLAEVLVMVFLAFLVQFNKRYLIPGDNWLSLKPAVSLISQRNVYEVFSTYPIFFGFILSGLALCSGFPVVNTYVFLFPLTALNILCFYTLVKTVFSMSDKICVLSSILYGLGGGLGWLIQMLIYNGTKDFWTLSLISQDMYFSVFFWSSIQFSYKSLAITLAYASIITFVVSIKLTMPTKKIILLAISSLLMVSSFMIHMIDVVFLAPIVVAVAYFYQKGQNRYFSLGIFIVILTSALLTIDFLMYGFYLSLTLIKMQVLLSTVHIERVYGFAFILINALFAIALAKRFLFTRMEKKYLFGKHSKSIKWVIVLSLFIAYISGLFVWPSISVSELSVGFPWYRYVTRYGFVGGLALLGLAATSWREKWFHIVLLWSIIPIASGSIWWGERTNAYLFPMLAILAAVGIDQIWIKTKDMIVNVCTVSAEKLLHSFKIRLRPVTAILIATILILSSTSVIYGASYYAFIEKAVDNDTIRVLLWISQNTLPNSTILVPKVYTISKGVYTISDRRVYETINLPRTIDSASFINTTQTFYSNNIMYLVTTETGTEQNFFLKCLILYLKLVFQSGNVKVFEVPRMLPPSSEYTVAVVNRELLGLMGENNTFTESQIIFLNMALPSLWPTNYTIVSDFNEVGNASIIVSIYDNIAQESIINRSTFANNFVFLNKSVETPVWGTEWREISSGILSGYFENKKVIIIGVNNLHGDLSSIAEKVYEELLNT